MSLFDLRPGVDETLDETEMGSLPDEARLHELCSALSAEYTRLIKEQVIKKVDPSRTFSIRDFQVLTTIYNTDQALTSSHIYKQTGLDPATVTRSVKILAAHDLLTIEENVIDSRSRLLSKTDAGEALSKTYGKACSNIFIPDAEDSAFRLNQSELKAIMSALVVLRQRAHILRNMRGVNRR